MLKKITPNSVEFGNKRWKVKERIEKKVGALIKMDWPIQFLMDMSKWKCLKKERRGRAVVTS